MSPRQIVPSSGGPMEPFLFRSALEVIAADAIGRSSIICRRVGSRLSFLFIDFNGVLALRISPRSPKTPGPSDNSTVQGPGYPCDTGADTLTGSFNWKYWNCRADGIRYKVNTAQCLVNLNKVLTHNLLPLQIASAQASSGALTLLPTAGALIGAPTKELWVVYKLMPVAGVLSMMLSLGGNIVPTDASGYEMQVRRFSYGGLIATRSKDEDVEEAVNIGTSDEPDSKIFADMVERRAKDVRGGQRFSRVWVGVALQLFWIAIVMIACWLAGSGGILYWYCTGWGWMWIWYLIVVASSILENYAGVPFSRQWTLRVSRAPKVRISDDAPLVRQPQGTTIFRQVEDNLSDIDPGKSKSIPTVQVFEEVPLVRRTASGRSTDILDALKAGFNCRGQITRDGMEPWSSSRVPFYVIISLEGISATHALLRILSKAITIGVFVTGTAMFASTQLIYLSMAVTVLCLVLAAGVFGRVIAMWIASEMMKTKPVLHRVVNNRDLAAEYIDRILAIDGLVVEVMGHVIVNGRCIQRYNQITAKSSWLGLLAGPYDIGKLTMVK